MKVKISVRYYVESAERVKAEVSCALPGSDKLIPGLQDAGCFVLGSPLYPTWGEREENGYRVRKEAFSAKDWESLEKTVDGQVEIIKTKVKEVYGRFQALKQNQPPDREIEIEL